MTTYVKITKTWLVPFKALEEENEATILKRARLWSESIETNTVDVGAVSHV